MSLPILDIFNLKLSFIDPSDPSKSIEALKGVTLTAGSGQFTSIVGESGSGKSVTSLAITGLVKPQRISGKILWRGGISERDLLSLGEKEFLGIRGKEIAYVFQDPASSLNPVLRVGPQIAEAYKAHFKTDGAAAESRAMEALAAVQLKDAQRVYRSYPHELSGGMRQRAMIAMALISAPKLLVADEPTTALDADVETEILKLLVKIKEERKLSILFITHDMGHASLYSDVIYAMKSGCVEERLERKNGVFVPQTPEAKRLFFASFWNVPPKSFLQV